METMEHPVPICATVSRKTGEITFEFIDDLETQIQFGRIMNRISRIAEAYMDTAAKAACADEFHDAAT